MSDGMTGTYDGEGSNIASGGTGGAPIGGNGLVAPAAPSPDVGLASNSTTSGQGRQGVVTIDRRKRLRTSSESARSETPISVSGGDQKLAYCSRGIYISTAGTLVCRLADNSADSTFSNLNAGSWYPFAVAIIRQTGTTAAGNVLF